LNVTLLIAGLLVTGGCTRQMPPYCSNYYRLTNEKRVDTINSSSMEDLFKLTLCDYYAEPADYKAAVAIADGGEKNVPFLLSKLSETDGHTKEAAVSVLGLMDSNNLLPQREEIIEIIEKSISEMKDDGFKDSSLRDLQWMKNKGRP
jgi:hypothetical protein